MADEKNKNLEKLVSFLNTSGWDVAKRTGDDARYEAFLNAFPKESLRSMNMDQYCIGDGSNASFSWWIERGLQPAIGRYMPGTSKGHLLYKMDDGTIYKNARLRAMSDEAALAYTLKIQQAIVNAGDDDLTWVDDNKEVFKRAGVQSVVSVSEGRKLRLLGVYRPDKFIPIASSGELGHFLLKFGVPPKDIPRYAKPVARMKVLHEIYDSVKNRVPGLSPYVFMKALYEPSLGLRLTKDLEGKASKVSALSDSAIQQAVTGNRSLNTILYGPPGTGKTFATIDEALIILDPGFYAANPEDNDSEVAIQDERRVKLKARYDELVDQGHLRFVTFHQSFSYEDFVEGIRALPGEQSGLRFEVVDGIFKELCTSAETRVTRTEAAPRDLEKRLVWKMSLGNTQEDESHIYDECVENDYILLGYGDAINFTGCSSRADVEEKFNQAKNESPNKEYAISIVDKFITKVRLGDLVVITSGNFKFRAIGEVVGPYEFAPKEDPTEGFAQKRRVKWLKVFDSALPFGMLLKKQFVQRTLYSIKEHILDRRKLADLLSSSEEGRVEVVSTTKAGRTDTIAQKKVLIIDEINRGNISRIFGELITLIEPSKRRGAEEALQVTLPYSKEPFSVPKNVFIVGTMNSADRSLSGLDVALRRRFTFKEMLPRPELLNSLDICGINVGLLLSVINDRIELLLDREHCIGHSYFLPLRERPEISHLAEIFRNRILPLLQEYFFDDWERIGWVLNDHREPDGVERFFVKPESSALSLFGTSIGATLSDDRWLLNNEALINPLSYLGVIGEYS